MSLTAQLQDAIAQSGATLYRIAKDSGLSYDAVYRFAYKQRGLTLESADKLAAFFEMRLTKPKRIRPK
jgi:hypothetical protein